MILNNMVQQYLLLRTLCHGDKITQRFMGDILTSDNINRLLLMDYSVPLPSHSEVFDDEMLPLVSCAENLRCYHQR